MGFPDRIERTVDRPSTGQGVGRPDHCRGSRHVVRECGDHRAAARWRGPDDMDERRQGVHAHRTGRRADRVRLHLGTACRTTIRAARTSSSRSSDRHRDPVDRSSNLASRNCPRTGPPRRSMATPRAGRANWVERFDNAADIEAVGALRPAHPSGRDPRGARSGRPRRRTLRLACPSPVRRSPNTWRCWPSRPGCARSGGWVLRATGCSLPPCRWRSSSWPPWPGTGIARSMPCRPISTPPRRTGRREERARKRAVHQQRHPGRPDPESVAPDRRTASEHRIVTRRLPRAKRCSPPRRSTRGWATSWRAKRRCHGVRLEKEYSLDTDDGPRALADLFDGRSQLLVYHFMFGPNITRLAAPSTRRSRTASMA